MSRKHHKEGLMQPGTGMSQSVVPREIHRRIPCDKSAAIVTSPGFQYAPDKRYTQTIWDVSPQIHQTPMTIKELVGFRNGRVEVVGYYGKGNHGHQWVVRCDCGRFEKRIGKRLKTANKRSDEGCQECNHASHLRERIRYMEGQAVQRLARNGGKR